LGFGVPQGPHRSFPQWAKVNGFHTNTQGPFELALRWMVMSVK
jgi:hypothetical protein